MNDRMPDFVNELGTKWWKEADLTAYAHRPDGFGTALPNVHCFLVQTTDGHKARVLVENGKIIYETGSIEKIGCRIDIMKLARRDDGN